MPPILLLLLYYGYLDDPEKRNQLASMKLYNERSQMIWETSVLQGEQEIVSHLINLPLVAKREFTAFNAQFSAPESRNLLVSFGGIITLEGQENPMQYHQVFHLIYQPEIASWYIHNDIFRLVFATK